MLVQITREREDIGPSPIVAPSDSVREEYAAKCQTCGACCSYYAYGVRRIKADGPIANDSRFAYFGIGVLTYQWPDGQKQTVRTSNYWMRVKYSRDKTKWPRCAALTGTIGVSVTCSIYEDRPRTCRVFEPGSEQCVNIRKWAGFE